ncbi:MAG: endopeptidase La [Clostridiales bacterium GWF2_36_10]|nr:MAG: endopeptidase La [Clostridiales bacterium GWF2_36_10]HAN20947.1 endopeptidase La [Clostridiales bacterium]
MNPNILETAVVTYNTIALRGVVVFPGITTSFEVGRKMSVKSFKDAFEREEPVFLVAQKDMSVVNPENDDLVKVGVIAVVKHALKLSNGNYQLMVEGLHRGERYNSYYENDTLKSDVAIIEEIKPEKSKQEEANAVSDALVILEEYLKYISKPSPEVVDEAKQITSASYLADFLASSFLINFDDRIAILDERDSIVRLDKLCKIFEKDMQLMQLEGTIQTKVRYRLQKSQREMYLREQLRTIQNELGIGDDDGEDDDDEYSKLINEAKIPDSVKDKLQEEANKLSKMPFGTPEATVIRNYIETCLELPWDKKSKDRVDIKLAEKILNEDHDGLTKVKERILEFMAVKQLKPDLSGQILCFVGPPGVGKTSIVRSIARATNRKYVRISLGGIRDEAEIRGHRRTYIGSMPGRIINALKLAGTANPVMLLDELDKLTSDAHGDPTSALLEVLDNDQNTTFRDNFIEIPVNISECLFIATANTTETIPAPLLDRMEIIYMSSYSDKEKMSIAKNHLIPKEIKKHGLNKRMIKFKDEAVNEIITSYSKENGVRGLEREIATVCRKVAKLIITDNIKNVVIDKNKVNELLGTVKFLPDKIYESDEVGIVNGLAWTSLGGEMLRIEALSMKGSGHLELTGSLGDVMKESAKAAISYIRKHSQELGVNEDFHSTKDLHIHVPEGAIPKDGPSAGITIATAIISELSGNAVRQNIAMTGEITLTGRVLPIGGLKEKSMAAYKSGAKTVIIPYDNRNDIVEFDEEIKSSLTFIPVKHISEVLDIAIIKQ